jgi:cytoskeletal protein CcmA (bactofilin family)
MARTTRDSGQAVIGRGTRVRGRVSGDGDLLVDGAVQGDIMLRGDLVIGDGAQATSNVEARAVTVRGELEGDVRASGLVRIEAGAKVRGDMHGESVAIEEGAEYTGRLDADFELPPELGGSGRGHEKGARRR